MSSKAMIHMEGSAVNDDRFSMTIRTSGPINDQMTMLARYIIQVSGDFKVPPGVFMHKLFVEVHQQEKGAAIYVDQKAIHDALDKIDGQKE